MSRSNTHPPRGGGRASLYAEITDGIIAQLEAGCAPWVQPWDSSAAAPIGLPRNAVTGRAYSGVNILILWNAVTRFGFPTQRWLTFRQTLGLGGHVRKGARGVTVVYAARFTPERERERARETGEAPGSVPFLKRFTVFNVAQCEGLPERIEAPGERVDRSLILPPVQEIINAMGVDFRIGGAHAFYSPTHDFVQIPAPQHFFAPIDWHRTALHELGHATGHTSRLARDQSGAFGSRSYSFEELVAEISCAYVCATLGITPTVRHADYVASWLEVLRDDDRAIVRAASLASKAADYLLALLPPADDDANDIEDDAPREVAGAAIEPART